MKKLFRRAISLLTVAAILATGLVTVIGSFTASAAEAVTEEWFYDFKSGTGTDSTIPAFLKSHPTRGSDNKDIHSWMSHGGRYNMGDISAEAPEPYFDENGLHMFSYYNGSENDNTAYYNSDGSAWARGFVLWDADIARQNAGVREFSDGTFADGTPRASFPDTADDANLYVTYGFCADPINSAGLIAVEDGLYAVTVKFKVSEMNTATTRLDVGVGVLNFEFREEGSWESTRTSYNYDYVTVTEVMDDWGYLTVIVDGSECKGTRGQNFFRVNISNDLYTDDGTYNQVDIESVSVERYYDAANDELGVRFINKDDHFRSADYFLGSVGSSVKMPEYNDGINNMYRWLVYDANGVNANNVNSLNNSLLDVSEASAKLANQTIPGGTLGKLRSDLDSSLPAGVYTMVPSVVAPETPIADAEYSFDMSGLVSAVKNNQGNMAESNINYSFSQALRQSATLTDEGYLQFTGTNGAWFGPGYDDTVNMDLGIQKVAFYTNKDSSNPGNFWYNGHRLRAGYTYTYTVTFRVEDHSGAASAVNMGFGVPTVEGAYWSTWNVNAIEGWRTGANGTDGWISRNDHVSVTDPDAEGFVTVTGSFVATGAMNNRFLMLLLAGNNETVTFKEIKIAQEYKAAYYINGEKTVVTNDTGLDLPELIPTEIVNGEMLNGKWYADEACTVEASAFTSGTRALYAGVNKVYEVNGTENGDVIATIDEDNNYVIEVKPDEGYKLAANGLSVVLDGVVTPVTLKADAEDADGKGSGTLFMIPANQEGSLTGITVKFVPVDEISLDVIATSIKGGDGAGLRFRGRVTKDADIVEAGFVLLPTAMLSGELTVDTENAVIGKTAYDDVIYDNTDAYRDFQVKLTGLNEKLMDTEISCVMYVKDANGNYTYSDVSAASYNAIKAVYDENGLVEGEDY